MVHHHTIECVKKAESLLADKPSDYLRYASLQLRMGIEYLFYEMIPLFKEELHDDIGKKWQPQKIIDAILECDPKADKDCRIGFGTADGPMFVKEVKAPSKQILKDHWHRLGSYLHAPVDLIQPETIKWLADLEKAVECLEQFNEGQALQNFRVLIEIDCYCGRKIKRNREGVEATGEMVCHKCCAIYSARIEGDIIHVELRKEPFPCPNCTTENFVPVHKIVEGQKITCCECNKRVEVRSGFFVVKIPE